MTFAGNSRVWPLATKRDDFTATTGLLASKSLSFVKWRRYSPRISPFSALTTTRTGSPSRTLGITVAIPLSDTLAVTVGTWSSLASR